MKHVGTREFRLNCCVCVDSDVPSKQRTLFGGKAACRKGQQQSAFSGCDRNQTVNHLSCKPIFGPFNQTFLEAPSKMHIISSLDTETRHSKTGVYHCKLAQMTFFSAERIVTLGPLQGLFMNLFCNVIISSNWFGF